MTDFIPETVIEYEKSFIFGFVKINIIIEDRKSININTKYKHIINVIVFGKRYSIVIRSPGIGVYTMNNDCITDKPECKQHW